MRTRGLTKMRIPSESFCHRSTILLSFSSATFEYMEKRSLELFRKWSPPRGVWEDVPERGRSSWPSPIPGNKNLRSWRAGGEQRTNFIPRFDIPWSMSTCWRHWIRVEMWREVGTSRRYLKDRKNMKHKRIHAASGSLTLSPEHRMTKRVNSSEHVFL